MNKALFKNPPAKFKGAPFWGWNGKIEKAEAESQIETFKEMGFGGYHIHPRSGMDTEYMSDEYLALVKACVEKGKKEEMYTYLYDEDRWPSGFGGGLVTKNPEFRARQLLFTPVSYEEYGEVNPEPNFSVTAQRAGNGELIACYDIALDENGVLKSFDMIDKDDTAKGTKWYAYAETAISSPWFNGYTNVDVLNPEATDEFIKVTHQRYYDVIGDDFGKYVPSIFGDEAQVSFKQMLHAPFDKTDVLLSWTPKLIEEYKSFYNADLTEVIPLLVWEGENSSEARYRYHNLIAELFARNYIDRIGKWCREHNLKFTGHMISEGDLAGQTSAIGDVMRAYRGLAIPGVDILCDCEDFLSVKQVASSSRQFGANGVLSELYGVTDWDFDFRDQKYQGDWQTALGVTLRCHHLSWYTMEGEAKRDYPPTLNYQAPWHNKYSYLENHYSRINYILSLGKQDVKIGVINPVESAWAHYGNKEQTTLAQRSIQKAYDFTVNTLMKNTVDFDCISEANMEMLYKKTSDNTLCLGEESYEIIILPCCETLRKSTQNMLCEFEKRGGKLVFVGEVSHFTDGMEENIFSSRKAMPLFEEKLLQTVEKYRKIRIYTSYGAPSNGFFHNHVKCDDGTEYLFLASCVRPAGKHNFASNKFTICINGEYSVNICDTLSGEIYPVNAERKNGKTYLEYDFYDCTSLLLELSSPEVRSVAAVEQKTGTAVNISSLMNYTLSEPNVLLLDKAQFSLDGGEFTENKDILLGDNDIRKTLGLPLRMDVLLQPWVVPDIYDHTVIMKFEVESEIDAAKAEFAAEHLEQAELTVNGKKIALESFGYYVDRSIKTVNIGTLKKGINTITLKMPFGEKANLENCFILGNFGVQLRGEKAVITSLNEKLYFGNVCEQKLPFYGGNITYHIAADGDLTVSNINYIGAAVEAGGSMEATFAPNKADVHCEKTLDITLYGNRFNTFGALHNISGRRFVSHPNEWRTSGIERSETYCVKTWGLMSQPVISKR